MEDINCKPKPRSPRVDRRKLPKKAQNLSKEELLLAFRRKKECNDKALSIVEKLIDPIYKQEDFLEHLKDINLCHYEDIVVERAISKLCGYPLCNEELLEIIDRQYHISMTTNKIYDLSERKHFCCNTCFKASVYIKNQLLTSPLWLRDLEIIPEFKLL